MFISSRIASVVLWFELELLGRMVMYFVLLKFILKSNLLQTSSIEVTKHSRFLRLSLVIAVISSSSLCRLLCINTVPIFNVNTHTHTLGCFICVRPPSGSCRRKSKVLPFFFTFFLVIEDALSFEVSVAKTAFGCQLISLSETSGCDWLNQLC